MTANGQPLAAGVQEMRGNLYSAEVQQPSCVTDWEFHFRKVYDNIEIVTNSSKIKETEIKRRAFTITVS